MSNQVNKGIVCISRAADIRKFMDIAYFGVSA